MRRGFANLVGGLAIASVLAIGNPFAAYATGDVADSTSIDVVENEVSTQAEGDVAQIGDKTTQRLMRQLPMLSKVRLSSFLAMQRPRG